MRLVALALTSAIAVVAPATAQAAVIFNVNGSFVGGGTLTGTFTTNDAITQVTAINLKSSALNGFQANTYSTFSTIDNQQLPNTFRLTATANGISDQVQFFFSPALTATGGTIGTNSFERQGAVGNRTLIGNVSVQSAVPEPATWAMMFLGFGVVGGAARYRRRKTVIAYA